MYVVGTTLLNAFWTDHPEAEGELRALCALLSEAGAEFETGDIPLAHSRVRLEINTAAGVARIAAVVPRETP